ncbi:MAG: hypothetical protein HQL32_13590 [Planctomycetes bacterium]|nr:hypothetical protein [Planctomycetota bacterium]
MDLFCQKAIECGASRIRIADTVGILSPMKTQKLFNHLQSICSKVEWEFHAHNDLGMATANTLTALESGATHASVTVNGIGERTGNAPLEEVALALDVEGDGYSGFALSKLSPLSQLVAKCSGRMIPPFKPVVGERIFEHESGIHCAGLLKDSRSYEAFAPDEVGHKNRSFILGKHSGTTVLMRLLAQEGEELDRKTASMLLELVKERAESDKKSLDIDEVRDLLQRVRHMQNAI